MSFNSVTRTKKNDDLPSSPSNGVLYEQLCDNCFWLYVVLSYVYVTVGAVIPFQVNFHTVITIFCNSFTSTCIACNKCSYCHSQKKENLRIKAYVQIVHGKCFKMHGSGSCPWLKSEKTYREKELHSKIH